MRIAETGIRQYLVADRVGVSDGHLSKILTGRKTVDDAMLALIAQAIEAVAAGAAA
jgi:transcriptional regulator with XRE-family HTH domain